MTRKILFMLVMVLAFASSSQAITISADKNENLGDMPSGSSLTINLRANDCKNPEKVRWTRKFTGRNPGFDFDNRRGYNVKFFADSLVKAPISSSEFSVIITAKDSDGSTASITFTGNILHAPLIETEKISQADSGRKYRQKFELSKGSEPLQWEISGDLPEGITLTTETSSRGKISHVLAGRTDEGGDFPFTLIVKNPVGTDTKNFTLTTGTAGARIKLPENFARNYTAVNHSDFSLDLSGVKISGTRPIIIDVDDAAKTSGLIYDAEKKLITGKISADTEKLRFKLIASNSYAEPASTDFTLNVKIVPSKIEVFTAKKSWQEYTAINGRNFSARFRADGSKPITWKFFKAEDDTEIKELGGLKFNEDGNISGVPDGSDGIKFYAAASNVAGQSKSDVHEIFFDNLPVLKFSEPVNLKNGQQVNINLRDYLAAPEMKKFPVEFKVSGDIPEGLSVENGILAGTLNITNPKNIKRYSITVTASNASGNSKGWLTIFINDVPKIDEIDEKDLTGRVGRNFILRIPTKTKQPYSWRLIYNGEEVNASSENEIGDSGLLWNVQTGEIYSAQYSLNDGEYPVSVYLSNDLGVDTKTFTIKIRR